MTKAEEYVGLTLQKKKLVKNKLDLNKTLANMKQLSMRHWAIERLLHSFKILATVPGLFLRPPDSFCFL